MFNLGTFYQTPVAAPTFNINAGTYTAAAFISAVQSYVSSGSTRGANAIRYNIRSGSAVGTITQWNRNIASWENVTSSGTGTQFPWARAKSGEYSTDNVNWYSKTTVSMYFDAVVSNASFWVELLDGINFI